MAMERGSQRLSLRLRIFEVAEERGSLSDDAALGFTLPRFSEWDWDATARIVGGPGSRQGAEFHYEVSSTLSVIRALASSPARY